MCVWEKGNAYTHDEHVAFSRSSHALIPNRGNLQVSTTSEAWRAWRALESLLKFGEDIRTALELFGESPTFREDLRTHPKLLSFNATDPTIGGQPLGHPNKVIIIITVISQIFGVLLFSVLSVHLFYT